MGVSSEPLAAHGPLQPGGLQRPASTGFPVSFARLFWILLLVPVSIEVSSFWIVNLPQFEQRADYYFVTAQHNLFNGRNRQCDVLIYGDSTAMVGLDPAKIQTATGLSTCNIAAPISTLEFVGMDPLNQYLERNPRPKFLVLQFSPRNFHPFPYSDGHAEPVDGLVVVMRHYGWRKVLPAIEKYPDYLVMLPQYVYVQGIQQILRNTFEAKRTSPSDGSYVILHRSRATPCVNLGLYHAPDSGWVQYLRGFYGARTDHLLLNVAPASSCSPQLSTWKSGFEAVSDNGLSGYPDSLRADDGLHPNRAGAIRLSQETSLQIQRVAGTAIASTPRDPAVPTRWATLSIRDENTSTLAKGFRQ